MKLSIGKWTLDTVTKIFSTTVDGPYPNGEDNTYYVVDDDTTLQFFNNDSTNGTVVTLDGGEKQSSFAFGANLIPIGTIDIPLNSLLNSGGRKSRSKNARKTRRSTHGRSVNSLDRREHRKRLLNEE
jgi:hypothetical protein